MSAAHVRVVLPFHLRRLAGSDGEVIVAVAGAVTAASVLEALEEVLPVLKGTIREHGSLKRRAFVRFFACGRDLSHEPADAPLPDAVATGAEPFRIVGAMSGG
ncbi:MAG: hypothetical protein U1E49_16445 [Hyphomicrobiaceae bacterium]